MPAGVNLDYYIAVAAEVVTAREEFGDASIIESICHSDASSDDECDKQDLTAPLPAQKAMDTFEVIHSFIGAYDNDIAMHTECESCATALMARKKKKQEELTDFSILMMPMDCIIQTDRVTG